MEWTVIVPLAVLVIALGSVLYEGNPRKPK